MCTEFPEDYKNNKTNIRVNLALFKLYFSNYKSNIKIFLEENFPKKIGVGEGKRYTPKFLYLKVNCFNFT